MAQRAENLKRAHQIGIHHHNGPGVIKLATVIGRTENSQKLPIGLKLVTVFNHLVGAADQVQAVACEKVGDDVVAEGVRNASVWGESGRMERWKVESGQVGEKAGG